MSFATKILFKIFKIDELHGHNVSGKTLNKNLKAKLPLDPLRIGYIKFLVESYYDEKESKLMLCGVTSNKQDLWKSCHTAINKSILISERKADAAAAAGKPFVFCDPSLAPYNESCNKKASSSHENGESDLNSSVEHGSKEDGSLYKKKKAKKYMGTVYSDLDEDMEDDDDDDEYDNGSDESSMAESPKKNGKMPGTIFLFIHTIVRRDIIKE
jgi:hypothetical protein